MDEAEEAELQAFQEVRSGKSVFVEERGTALLKCVGALQAKGGEEAQGKVSARSAGLDESGSFCIQIGDRERFRGLQAVRR